MRRDDSNLQNLYTIAQALGPLREQVVFVGGATAGLLVTDPAADSVRPTMDVDGIVMAATLSQFYAFEAALAQRGFVRDADSDVICRWRHRDSGIPFDLMPTDPTILGFANRWYPEAAATAVGVRLGNDLQLRVVSAPAFLATKFEAFRGRGRGDLMASHDVEDILNVIDGRPELAEEIASTSHALRQAATDAVRSLLEHRDFPNALPGLLSEPDRATVVHRRMRAIASLA